MTDQALQDQKPYGYIYKITNLVNGKIYVGQTTKDIEFRMKQHRINSRSRKKIYDTSTAIANALLKYDADAFKIEAVEVCDNQELLNDREVFWIENLSSMSPNGYNLRTGGMKNTLSAESRRKISMSLKATFKNPEIRQKISNAKKGKKLSPEALARCRERPMEAYRTEKYRERARQNTKERWSNPEYAAKMRKHADDRIGKKATEDHCRKISEGQKGRKLSEEHRRKISEHRKGSKASPETRAKLSDIRKGSHPNFKPESYKKWQESLDRINLKKNLVSLFDVFDSEGIFLGRFNHKAECAKFLGTYTQFVTKWLSGERKSKKYTFRFLDENKDGKS